MTAYATHLDIPSSFYSHIYVYLHFIIYPIALYITIPITTSVAVYITAFCIVLYDNIFCIAVWCYITVYVFDLFFLHIFILSLSCFCVRTAVTGCDVCCILMGSFFFLFVYILDDRISHIQQSDVFYIFGNFFHILYMAIYFLFF